VEVALRPFLMHFKQHVGLRNRKYYTPMGGRKMDVVPFYKNWRENETTWQLLKTKKNSCVIALFPCGSTAFLLFS